MNLFMRFFVDDICHLHQNRPKIDAVDIPADTSVSSQFRNLPATSAFSTSKTDKDDSFMVCQNNPN